MTTVVCAVRVFLLDRMELKEVGEEFLDQRISLAAVTEINILARSSIWPRDFCAPRIFCF